MKAWRFHGFNDLRLDDVPEPVCAPGHVLVEPLCVQPSVTEAQLACGIPTLAFDRIKRRLETESPVQLFGHEFCARIVATGPGVSRFRPGDRVAARAKLPMYGISMFGMSSGCSNSSEATTTDIVRELVADVVLVDEGHIERAVNAYLTLQKTMAEGAGAAGLWS